MTLPVVFTANGATGYNLTKSLRFRSSASAYLNRTPASAGNRRTWTYSAWVKRGTLGTRNIIAQAEAGGNTNAVIEFNSSDQLRFFQQVGGVDNFQLITTQVFRDPSAWYHIVIQLDTTQATSTNRAKLYVNGLQITAFSTAVYPAQNFDGSFNNNVAQYIGAWTAVPQYFDGYMAEVNSIDGQALTPSSFGSTNALTGVWQPAKYTGTYGTNGFYLPFTNTTSTSTLGNDFSGNSNTWTVNNISLTTGSTYDSMNDVPTLTSATQSNYATLNPTVPKTYCTQTDGNLKSAGTSSIDSDTSVATIGVSSGKWYWEDKIGTISSAVYPILGAGRNILSSFVGLYSGISSVGGFGIVVGNGNIIKEGSTVTTVTALVANDVVGYALDLGALTCAIYKNNSLIYTITSLTAGTYYPMANEYNTSNSTHNYGQQSFTYTPPTGFVALNTYNLPTSTIVKGNTVMDATLYTGNGSAATDVQTITNAGGFKPDLVWTKSRSNAVSHHIGDSVRGIDKTLFSNLTAAEQTYTYDIHAFNSNGFTVGNDGTQNTSGYTYVGWQWQAGQGTTSSNTNGSITSTVSVNATAGFSIVTYTGTGSTGTVGHGLGVAPKMIISKNRSAAEDWRVAHTGLTNMASWHCNLNTTQAQSNSGAAIWNNTTPTSTIFGVGTDTSVSGSGNLIVAYCWTPIAGYSAFGSYIGNGSSDGTFVFTGFRPKFFMIKSTGVESWEMFDTSRDTYNQAVGLLEANSSGAENTSNTSAIDILSNGFKQRNTRAATNGSGSTYIYMAFAENPFKNALAR